MRMLRTLCAKTLKDKISNNKNREMTAVECIDDFPREQRLRWLGHVETMDKEKGSVKVLHFNFEDTRKRRPKKR